MADDGHRRGIRRTFRLSGGTGGDPRTEVREELEHHLELCTRELMDEGWPRAEAEAEARRRFGDLEYTTDYCARETARAHAAGTRTMWIDDLRQDLKYALRTLLRSPTYALVVLVTLAAGIAANTTIFSLMNPYLFRPLPYAEPEALVQLGGVDPLAGWDGGRFSASQIADLEARARSVGELGYYYYGTLNVTGGDQAERRQVGYMSGNLFRLLGTPPLLGRYLLDDDAGPGGPEVVVLGEDLWRDRYGADPEMVGSTLELDGRSHTVVGVMPRAFSFPFGGLHLWLPTRFDPTSSPRDDMYVLPVGRLQPGWDRESAREELTAVQAELAALHPRVDGQYEGVSVKPLREALNFVWDILRLGFFLLLGAVAFVLVIACVNVASLTLARASGRTREVAVRSAVGADRGRVVRQLVTESFILALLGGALGIGGAYLVTGLLNGILPDDIYRVGDVSVDGRVLLFSSVVTLATPFFFGLAPALSLSRTPLGTALRSGGGAGAGRKALRGRQFLVVVEVALAIALVTGTGLMVRSLQAVTSVDLGFQADRIALATITPDASRYPGTPELEAYYSRAREEVAALPGVTAVGLAGAIPLNHETFPVRYQAAEGAAGPVEEWPSALTSRVDGAYFDAMGIPLLAGRAFQPTDYEEGSAVIVSRELATTLFPGGGAVGRALRYGTGEDETSATIVGVVGEVRYDDLVSEERPHIYRPLEGSPARRRFLVVRTQGDPGALSGSLRTALAGVDPNLPASFRRYGEIVQESTLLWAMSSAFLGVFGLVALSLAALGIYGLMAFSVAQRRREMGLRMALGAPGASLQRSVVMGGLKLTLVGAGAGLVLAMAGGAAARSVLFGVSALDPVTLGGVTLLFLLVATAAAAIPARRAARVDPLQVLRSE